MIATAACPRCLWERTAAGRETPIAVAIALRAHYEVWHSAYDPSAMSIVPLISAPPPRTRRRVIAHSHPAPAAV